MNTEGKDYDGQELLALARAAIARHFDAEQALPALTEALRQPAATFVTLTPAG
jgi:hypothetical protein